MSLLDRSKGKEIETDTSPTNSAAILAALATVLPSYLPTPKSQILPKYISIGRRDVCSNLQDERIPFSEIFTHLLKDITPNLNLSSLSPRYYGFVIGGTTPAALTADILASIYDQNVHVHLPKETIATDVEVAALNMLLDLFYLPRAEWGISVNPRWGSEGGCGTFTTGATASNVLGLALGREFVLKERMGLDTGASDGMSVAEHGIGEVMDAAGVRKVQILSTMPHSSIAKAASLVGIGRANVISIANSEKDFLSIDFEKLKKELSKTDTASIVVVSAGEVNTGRFATTKEEMTLLRELCDKNMAWIHVDGAFGLFGRVLKGLEGMEREEFDGVIRGTEGLELADSITGDGHKLLNVPYDCGFFFTRHKRLAEEVCRNGGAAYLTPAVVDGDGNGIQSPLNIGIENSRRFRALPVYATLLSYGRNGYVDMLMRQVRLARRVVGWLCESEEFEVLPRGEKKQNMLKKTFMIVLFRATDERMNEELVKRINGTGKIYVSGTKWNGRPAARIAISNWRVDVERDARVIQDVFESLVR